MEEFNLIKKTFFILSILALIAVSLSCVSAADTGNNATANLEDLAGEINSTDVGETLNLNQDYKSTNSSNQIIISKSITIDGNNHTIEAPDVKRVFLVNADNVCIKNLNFINSKATGLAGGVISWWGNNGTLSNCNFENNSASSAAGAVLWKGNDGLIESCNFINNNVTYGPAVGLTSGESFDPHQIHIQVVNSEGGALYLQGYNLLVNNCNFLNNLALFNGGAICVHWYSNVTISNSRFKNNSAAEYSGALHLDGDNPTVIGCDFENNHQKDLQIHAHAAIVNSTFDCLSSIEDEYNSSYINVTFRYGNSFEDLSLKINNTPEGGVLVLDRNYIYINGLNKGILINKSIVIDGNGHTLDGNNASRIFNISADNVVIKNINFINGNPIAKYFSNDIGGGAIYWNGANGIVKNCNFSNNEIRGIEDDPFDKEEEIVTEDGLIIHTIRFRQMGAKITEGGAIVWNGTNGTVSDCVFRNNHVGYANSGGAVQWRGSNGKILKSQFYQNDAWCGAAVCWVGDNGFISESIIMDNGFFDGGIYWFGKNGTVVHSVLVGNNYPLVLRSSEKLNADYNFWGDTIYNISKVEKPAFVSKWLILNYNHDGKFLLKGDNITVSYDLSYLVDISGKISRYDGASGLYGGKINYTAEKTGYLDITFNNGIKIKIDAREAIVSSDLTKYYQNSKISFKVTVYDLIGKVISKKVKFTVNSKSYFVKTDKNGVATLKLKFKPGKYTIYSAYGDVKVKNKITIKNTLITKNLYKKFKKSGKFHVKVLNSKGKAFAKKVVKINFKGKTYKIKTNKKGIATFKVSKNLKIGKYTIKTSYNGLTNTNKIIVKK